MLACESLGGDSEDVIQKLSFLDPVAGFAAMGQKPRGANFPTHNPTHKK